MTASREATVGLLAAALRHMAGKLPAEEWSGLALDVINAIRVYEDRAPAGFERAPEGPL